MQRGDDFIRQIVFLESNKPSFLDIYHQIRSVEQFVQQIDAHFNLIPTHQQKKE